MAPLGGIGLGNLLAEQGDARRAGGLPASDRIRPPRRAPRAAFNLGNLLEKQGDPQGARRAYQRAIESGDAEAAPIAMAALKNLTT